jgi:hypothetical protein
MRNHSLDESPRTANGANTNTAPQASRPPTDEAPRTAQNHPGEVRLDQFDCELPPGVRAELLAPKRARMLGRPTRDLMPSWLKNLLTFTGIICVPLALILVAFGALPHSPPTPIAPPSPISPTQPISQPPLQQPPSQPQQLVWEWVRSETYGPVWVQCYETCTPARGGLIVRDPAPHAQLVRDPVTRAELVSMPIGARAE